MIEFSFFSKLETTLKKLNGFEGVNVTAQRYWFINFMCHFFYFHKEVVVVDNMSVIKTNTSGSLRASILYNKKNIYIIIIVTYIYN